ATPADRGSSRCSRFFGVPPKNTSAEFLRRWVDLLYDLKPLGQRLWVGYRSAIRLSISAPSPQDTLVIEASNAQRNQSHLADTENQHQQRDRIIIEPMSTLCTDAFKTFRC